jgi:endonuclease G
MLTRSLSLALALALTSTSAFPYNFGACAAMFPATGQPISQFEKVLKPRPLCFAGFAVLHSGVRHSPIYTVERLNAPRINDAHNNERTNKFYPEARLPSADRAQLSDYARTGYDRGHMAPAADMAGPDAMAQSFSLANMVPQAPINNRKTWAKIEKDTRKYVLRASSDVFVFTGPFYGPAARSIGPNKVLVPDALFKLVFDPSTGRAWAHWLENTDAARGTAPISYAELVKRTRIEFLPGVKLTQ